MKVISKKQKAIITGACGTIGLALSKHLIGKGIDVIGVDRKDRQYPSRFFSGDLLDKTFFTNIVKQVCDDQAIVSVIHLAGQSDAKLCEDDPLEAFRQNTLATVNVLEGCAKNQISKFIFASTSYVYGDTYQENVTEEFNIQPLGIYPLSKAASEVIIKDYPQQNKMSCYVVRISNVYGPDLKPGTVLEKMMSQYYQNEKISLNNLTPIRDFIYIDDVVEGLSRLMMVEEEASCRFFNLSTARATSMGELVELFCELKGLSQKFEHKSVESGQKISRLVLDNQALKQHLQWQPSITLRDGLTKIFKIKEETCSNVKT
jgi:nucleoside-diphosphate-sugar epimerase